MATIPDNNQTMIVDGEIQIKSISGYRELAGRVAFTGPSDTRYGQMRVFGSSGQYYHLMDCTGCSEGFCVRTITNQGSTVIGGVNEPYAFQVRGLNTTARNLSVFQPLTTAPVLNGNAVFAASRYSTENASSLTNAVANFWQQNWRAGETLNVTVGMSPFTAYGYMGYKSPTASYSNSSNQVILGHNFNGTNVDAVLISSTGNVNIPNRLDVGTLSATNYLNLPLAPLTLDSTNGRVGINMATPTEALDVTGNALVSGTLTASSLGGTLTTASQPNITSVGTLDGLTVAGNVSQTTGTASLGDLTVPSVSCSGNISGTLTTAAQPNITSVGTLGGLTVAGNVSQTTGTASLGDLTVPSVSCSGNISGTLTTAAQPNITSVGTLGGLTVAGNVSQTTGTASLGDLTVPSVSCSGNISGTLTTAAQPNITSVGTLGGLTVAGNVSQTTGTASFGALTVPSISCSGNISGTLTTAAQPNITSVGTLSTLNVTGDVNIDSNTLKVDSTNNRVGINTTNPIQALDIVGSIMASQSVIINPTSVGTKLYLYNSGGSKYGLGISPSQQNYFSAGIHRFYCGGENDSGTLLLTIANTGNIAQSIGTASFGALTVPSISCSGNISGTLTTAAQPNITSVGTLSTLDVTGNINIDSNTLRVDSVNNRVGINTASPQQALDVVGNLRVTGVTSLEGGSTTVTNLYLREGGSSDANNLFYLQQAVNYMMIDAKSQTGSLSAAGILLRTSAAGSNVLSEALRLEGDATARLYGNIIQVTTKTATLGGTSTTYLNTGSIRVNSLGSIISSNGTPEGVTTATVGSLYLRGDGAGGTALYIKETGTGNTGWKPVMTDVLPITLDKTNNRIGINKTTPTEALDVTGNALVSGTLTASSLGGTVTTAAQPNITSVGTLGGLTVAGNVSQTTGTASFGALTVPSISCSGNISGTLTTAAQPNITSVGTLSTLNVTGDVNIDSNTLKVDSTNNRVGINQSNPTHSLDVVGNARITSDLSVDGTTLVVDSATHSVSINGTLVKAGTGTPEAVVTAPVGSLFMRSDGAAGTTLYTKESGTGNTGWAAVATTTSTSNTTIYKNAAAFNNTAAGLNTGSWQQILSFTIPANSVCLVDIILNVQKVVSTTHPTLNVRMQSTNTYSSTIKTDKRNCHLYTDRDLGVNLAPLNILGSDAVAEYSAHLVLNEVQTNTTASPITQYVGYYFAPNTYYSLAANVFQVAANNCVVTVTKIGTI